MCTNVFSSSPCVWFMLGLSESRFFLAGSIGGIAGVVAGQPFDTIKVHTSFKDHSPFLLLVLCIITLCVLCVLFVCVQVRLQTQCLARAKARGYTVWSTVQHMFWEEGIRGFYRGTLPQLPHSRTPTLPHTTLLLTTTMFYTQQACHHPS